MAASRRLLPPGESIDAAALMDMEFSVSRAIIPGLLYVGLTILASGWIISALPVLLSFAAGAMVYVVVEELIPEMSQGEHSHMGVLAFTVGFTLMMTLDVALG